MAASTLLQELRWELRELVKALGSLRFYLVLMVMAAGLALAALAVNGIIIPRAFAASGVSGIAVLIFYVAGWPSVGVLYLLLNIPLFVLGWREYTLKYVVISLLGAFLFSGFLEVTRGIAIEVADPLLAAILAGVMIGAGAGAYLRLGGSAGGLDIVAALIRKKLGIPMGRVFITVNAVNLAGAWIINDLNTALYSAMLLWVLSYTMDKVQTGFSQRRAVLIMSDRPDEVAEQVMKRLNRGVTFFHSHGGQSGKSAKVVYSVINMMELGKMKELLFEIDPQAFVVVYNTSEVIGKHFLTWEEEGYLKRP